MLICPICRYSLKKENKSLKCENGHCFDIAKQGYVNLLPVQNKHSLHPGDTKEMLAARRNFLNSGNYKKICDEVLKAADSILKKHYTPVIADVGCGEGYYTQAIASHFKNCTVCGIDISKDAVKMACSRSKDIKWIVATASLLPIEDKSVDLVIAMFSLFLEEEFSRILKKDGFAIEVTVATEHLIELKNIIYEEVFQQNKKPADVTGFKTVSCKKHSFKLLLDDKNLIELLHMTPHFWRIKQDKREEFEKIKELEVTIAFWVRLLKKQKEEI